MSEQFRPARLLSIWADFNALDTERRFTASLRFADSALLPGIGETVRLFDHEGNSVFGAVDAINGLVVHVQPDLSTWRASAVAIGPSPFTHSRSFQKPLSAATVAIEANGKGVQVK